MDSLSISSAIPYVFSPKTTPFSKRPLLIPLLSKNKEDESDLHSDAAAETTSLVRFIRTPTSLSPLSKDSAMGLVLSAAVGRGWTTGSGMEGPANPEADPADGGVGRGREVTTFPWSLFTKSPRRRMRVAFTCNFCGQRTTRAINPHAYTDGTVFVQCCGCNVFHKLVDNLNLFHEIKCYVNPCFLHKGDMSFNFFNEDEDEDEDEDDDDNDGGNMFPLI